MRNFLFMTSFFTFILYGYQGRAQTNSNITQQICVGYSGNYQVDFNENAGSGTTGSTYTWSVITSGFLGTITPNQGPGSSSNRILIDWGSTPIGTYQLQVVENNANCQNNPIVLNIIIVPILTPTFNSIDPLCENSPSPVLPTTSTNGVNGTWNPATISTASTGTSTYTFTPNAGQCATTATLSVTVYQSVPTTFNTIVTDPFSTNPSITVITSLNGSFIYQLDNGIKQTTNVFQNVSSGIHVITVFDASGCALPTSSNVLVVDYPRYFTPNGDGYNDTWNISDLSSQQKSQIFIFDRYGKLLKQIFPYSSGWDGKYNGNDLPSTDYWFTVDYEYNNIILQFKSHFSLKR